MNIFHEVYALIGVEFWWLIFFGIEGKIGERWNNWKGKKRDWISIPLFFAGAFLITYLFEVRLVTLGLTLLALLAMDYLFRNQQSKFTHVVR